MGHPQNLTRKNPGEGQFVPLFVVDRRYRSVSAAPTIRRANGAIRSAFPTIRRV